MPRKDDHLTRVDLAFYPDTVNDWLRFGAPWRLEHLDRRRSRAWFRPHATFSYVRWRANEYGTQSWRCFVLQAAAPAEIATRVPGVHPGAHVLVNVSGVTYSKRLLSLFDDLEIIVNDLSDVSPAYWRQAQLRVPLKLEPHAYAVEQSGAAATLAGLVL